MNGPTAGASVEKPTASASGRVTTMQPIRLTVDGKTLARVNARATEDARARQ